ncbi:MAG: DUF4919 domain-containing protein [Acidobacteriota bacterium]|nr:MAG: DUF4919 domain-containing protein [Acidobacteriota bacterium]
MMSQDEDTDFTSLRMLWTDQPNYDPYIHLDPTYVRRMRVMEQALMDGDFKRAAKTCSRHYDRYFVDLGWNFFCLHSYSGLDDQERFGFHEFVFSGLLQSIKASGDGRSAETAFKVISLTEEYGALNALRMTARRQSLITIDGIPYDKMEVVEEASGQTDVIYFNIMPIMTWLDQQFEG